MRFRGADARFITADRLGGALLPALMAEPRSLPDPNAPCPNPSMHARAVTPERCQDPEYWRALCPELHVEDERFAASVGPMRVDRGFAQDVRNAIIDQGFTKIPSHKLPWKTTDHRALAFAAITLMQHGWNPSWLLVYDEAWAVAHELSEFMFRTTGNHLNHDALAWHVSIDDEKPTAFSPHRDRQPDDARETFREDGTAQYATAWVPLTDASPDGNSCLAFIPASLDPGYLEGDPEDPGLSHEQSDPLRRCLPHKEAYQHITCVPAETGSIVVFTHRVIHWGTAPVKKTPASYASRNEPRVCVSFGFADARYEPSYLRKIVSNTQVGTVEMYPRLYARVALVAAQMVSYHERFPSDARALKKYHALLAHPRDPLDPEYKRKVLREYVSAVGMASGTGTGTGTPRGRSSGTCVGRGRDQRSGDEIPGDGGDDVLEDGTVSDARGGSSDGDDCEDAMEAALEAMLDAEMAGRVEDFEDDFDALAAEEERERKKAKRRR